MMVTDLSGETMQGPGRGLQDRRERRHRGGLVSGHYPAISPPGCSSEGLKGMRSPAGRRNEREREREQQSRHGTGRYGRSAHALTSR